ncbi:hypothetical protein ABZ137_00020 [Streptomyces bobili]|uniref:hypothetical protein n=1 Tax=Streptomyces bobili TaxID=67280 RepID=UPI0033BB34E1
MHAGSELPERITTRRAELDELEEQLAKQLAEVRDERDELAPTRKTPWATAACTLAVAVTMAPLAACTAACPALADGATYPAALARAAVTFAGTLPLLAVLTSTVACLLR